MKKNNLLRISWIIGIYATLVLILYLVVLYKVKWEGRDFNTYLYFYNCSNELCTSTEEPETYYGQVVCNEDKCPHITSKNGEYLVLTNNDKQMLYNYKQDKIINEDYKEYKQTSDSNYIVVDESGESAVINIAGELIQEFTTKRLTDYKYGYSVYKENGRYGIMSEANDIYIEPGYEEIILINDSLYAYLEEEKYYIASYSTEVPVNSRSYDYVIPVNNIILAFNEKQLDILDNNLQSKLLMRIDCSYSYKREKERDTLEIKQKDDFIFFSIYNGDSVYTNYLYDIKNNKLYS